MGKNIVNASKELLSSSGYAIVFAFRNDPRNALQDILACESLAPIKELLELCQAEGACENKYRNTHLLSLAESASVSNLYKLFNHMKNTRSGVDAVARHADLVVEVLNVRAAVGDMMGAANNVADNIDSVSNTMCHLLAVQAVLRPQKPGEVRQELGLEQQHHAGE